MKILITGGAGFIGSNLAEYISQAEVGHEIVVLDNLSTGKLQNLEGIEVQFVQGSVADQRVVHEAALGADSIVHLAALGSVPRSVSDPLSSHVANLNGTLNVLEAARANKSHFVFASSSSVYGANTKLPKSELDWTRPMSPYAATKLGAEAYTIAYNYSYGVESLALRFFNVYGPKQAADHAYAAVIPKFIDAALRGEAIELHGDGMQSRDFTYVETVCSAIFTAIQNRMTSTSPINLAFGTRTTLVDLVDLVEKELALSLRRQFVAPRVGDVRGSQADGLLFRELFPDIYPINLAEGISKTVPWFKQNTPHSSKGAHRTTSNKS